MLLEFVGLVTTLLVTFFFLMQVLARLLNLKQPSVMSGNMPKLVPVPIPTKKQPTFVHKMVAYVTQVRKWQLAEDWAYCHEGRTIIIPRDFIFDGASIPRPLWGILSPIGLLLIPGLIHDFGYRYDYLWIRSEDAEHGYAKTDIGLGRKHWDKIFYKVGSDVNGLVLLDWLAWLSLVLGGKFAWKKNRKRNAPEVFPNEQSEQRAEERVDQQVGEQKPGDNKPGQELPSA